MSTNSATKTRLSWRLNELSEATGLSVPFLRNEARAGNLKTRKLGGAVIVLDDDVRRYLTGEGAENTNPQSAVSRKRGKRDFYS